MIYATKLLVLWLLRTMFIALLMYMAVDSLLSHYIGVPSSMGTCLKET